MPATTIISQIPGLTALSMGTGWTVAGSQTQDLTAYTLHQVTDRTKAPAAVEQATFVMVGPRGDIFVPTYKQPRCSIPPAILTAANSDGTDAATIDVNTPGLDAAYLSYEDAVRDSVDTVYADQVPEFLGNMGETLITMGVAATSPYTTSSF